MILGPFGASTVHYCPLWVALILFAAGVVNFLPQRRRARYIRMPGNHRRVRAAVKIRTSEPSWDGEPT